MAAASGIPRTRGGLSGLLLILLGAWGALVPFVGPYFHYAYTPDRTWAYTSGRLWLDIAPGAAAVVGGFIVLGTRSRVAGVLGALLAALGGAWFVAGATVTAQLVRSGSISRSINPGLPVGTAGGPNASSLRQFLESLGFFTGTGVLIVFFAALALGRFSVAGGPADEQEPWAAHPAPLDEARQQEAFPASQDQFPASQDQLPTIASQYPPGGSQPSPTGQVPPQHNAFGQQREQGAVGPQQQQSPTAAGQVPSSSPTEQFPASSPPTEQFPASSPDTEEFPAS
jgi:hypothetical protein